MSDQPTPDEQVEAEVRRIVRDELAARAQAEADDGGDPPPEVDPDDVAQAVEDELGAPAPPPDDAPAPPPDGGDPDEPVAGDETPPDTRGPLARAWFGDGDE